MVALASRAQPRAAAVRGELGLALAVATIVIGGAALRVGVGGGVGPLSAAVMAVLLAAGGWTAARVLAGPRAAAAVAVVLMLLFDLAGLPSRNPPAYDDLQALYRTDQELSARLPRTSNAASVITVVAQPVFTGAQPDFGLGGTVDGTPVAWTCAFSHGVQRIALPVPGAALGARSSADVTLRLTGSPGRDSDYLIVYASSKQGGPLISLEPAATASQTATVCSVV